jgi:DNA-binding NarL/FixJ family response regulator
LREDVATEVTPVVICSEDDNPLLVREAQRLGAAAYLLKANLLPSRLSQTISDVLGQRGELIAHAGHSGVRQAS